MLLELDRTWKKRNPISFGICNVWERRKGFSVSSIEHVNHTDMIAIFAVACHVPVVLALEQKGRGVYLMLMYNVLTRRQVQSRVVSDSLAGMVVLHNSVYCLPSALASTYKLATCGISKYSSSLGHTFPLMAENRIRSYGQWCRINNLVIMHLYPRLNTYFIFLCSQNK